MLVSIVPRLRGGLTAQLERFQEQARGHARFEAAARIHVAYEQLVRGRQLGVGRGGRDPGGAHHRAAAGRRDDSRILRR